MNTLACVIYAVANGPANWWRVHLKDEDEDEVQVEGF